MTTIAYRDGVLAADTLIGVGDTKLPDVALKVHKLDAGALFGAAGNLESIEQLRHAVENGHPTPQLKKIEAILVHPNSDVFTYEGVRWMKCVPTPYIALGSGANFALAAMWCGADAIKAVECGIAHDRNSGGPVRSVRLRKTKSNLLHGERGRGVEEVR